MAKGATPIRKVMKEDLEPLDVEIRTPSVVVSVRLDESTAKRLHALAKRRGVRVSDILRDAATLYADAGGHEIGHQFDVAWLDVRVQMGTLPVTTAARTRDVTDAMQARVPVDTPKTVLARTG